jgi:hypothetical protein
VSLCFTYSHWSLGGCEFQSGQHGSNEWCGDIKTSFILVCEIFDKTLTPSEGVNDVVSRWCQHGVWRYECESAKTRASVCRKMAATMWQCVTKAKTKTKHYIKLCDQVCEPKDKSAVEAMPMFRGVEAAISIVLKAKRWLIDVLLFQKQNKFTLIVFIFST